MLHSDTPLIIAIITEGCRIWEKSTVSLPQRFCRFSLRGNTNFDRIFFGVHMSRHNGNYRMIAFYWYVLCIGILLSWHANDVMFLGCQANFGTQKNIATGTIVHPYDANCVTPLIYPTTDLDFLFVIIVLFDLSFYFLIPSHNLFVIGIIPPL